MPDGEFVPGQQNEEDSHLADETPEEEPETETEEPAEEPTPPPAPEPETGTGLL
jgi:hypothetical protein